MSKKFFYAISVPIAFIFFLIPSVFAEDKSIVSSFCNNVLLKITANDSRIMTWNGDVSIEHKIYEPTTGKLQGETVANITFAVNVAQDKRMSVIRLVKDEQPENDGVYRKRPLIIQGFLFRDGLTYAFNDVDPNGPLPNPDNIVGSVTAAHADTSKPYVSSMDVPPFQLKGNIRIGEGYHSIPTLSFPSFDYFNPFECCSLGINRTMGLKSFTKRLESEHGFDKKRNASIKKQNGTTILHREAIRKDGKTIVNEDTFNAESLCIKSFCGILDQPPVAGRYEVVTETNYQKYGDIWLPKNVSFTLEHAKWCYKITFLKQKVNIPLDDSVFSLKALGVHQGDMVRDMRTNASYAIDDSSLPVRDIAKLLYRPKYGFVRYVIIALGVVMIITSLFLRYRQWRANQPEAKR